MCQITFVLLPLCPWLITLTLWPPRGPVCKEFVSRHVLRAVRTRILLWDLYARDTSRVPRWTLRCIDGHGIIGV